MLTRRCPACIVWMGILCVVVGCERSGTTADVVSIVIPPDSVVATITPPPGEYFNGIIGAFLLQDDGIVVVDNDVRVQYFDAAGTHIRTVGGPGAGPGESRWITKAALSENDTLFTYDAAGGAATFWTPEGEYARSVQARADVWSRNILPLADGSIVFEQETPGPAPVRGEVVTRSEKVLMRMADERATELASYDGDETLVLMLTGGRIGGGVELLFHTHLAVDGTRALIGDGKTGEVTVFDMERVEALSFTVPAPDRSQLSARDVGQFIEALMTSSRLQNQEREIERGLESDRLVPAITGMLVDDTHRIWVEQFSYDRDADGVVSWDRTRLRRKYAVFSSDGEPLATVTLPPAFRPTHVARATIVGVQRSELGEESIALYNVPAALR